MVDRLNKPLDAIIADQDRQTQRRRGGGAGGIRASQGARNNRKMEPYDINRRSARENSRIDRSLDGPQPYECAMKILLNNNMAGSFIGNAGFAIKDLIEITGASIHISNPSNPYPGSNERVVFITGSESAVGLAQGLIWEMIGQQTQAVNAGLQIVWNPAAAKASPGEYDEEDVQCRIVVPAASAGRVLGKGGNIFRKMMSDSGVEATMSPVEDADLLQERLISIEGTVGGCMDFTAKLLVKLMEVPDGCQYVHSGTAYPRQLTADTGVVNSGGGRGGRNDNRNSNNGGGGGSNRRNVMDEIEMFKPEGRNGGRGSGGMMHVQTAASPSIFTTLLPCQTNFLRLLSLAICFILCFLLLFLLGFSKGFTGGAETLSANTTIELAVPNHLVGAILGVQVRFTCYCTQS